MNILKLDKQIAILSALVEGNSIRSTERMTQTHRDTIMRLLRRVGDHCPRLMDHHLRGLQLVGKRNGQTALQFLIALQKQLAQDGRIQFTTDGLLAYRDAVELTFGAEIDYAQAVKFYASVEAGDGRYSLPRVSEVLKTVIVGNPDPGHISTSYVQRQNLTMRMAMRRFTRLANAFSKKLQNLKAALALHFAHYNFLRVHRSLRVTPAMETGITNHIWTWKELLPAIMV